MIKHAEKSKQVDALTKKLSKATMVVFTSFEGLDVASVTELRKQCRKSSVGYHVLKNTLIDRAFQGIKVQGLGDWLKGTTAVAIGSDDPVTAAKVIQEFAAQNDKLKIKGGLMGATRLKSAEVMALAKLPSRQVLLGQLAGSLEAPITNLVFVLSGVLRQVVTGLQAVHDKKSKSA